MKEILDLFQKAQKNISTHQKLLGSLRNIYKNGNTEELQDSLFICLDILFCGDHKNNKERTIRVITFIAQFLLDLLTEHDDDENEHPLVRAVINRTLQHTTLINPSCRYHSTKLLETVFRRAQPDFAMTVELCEDIQEHLIDRFISDNFISIRLLSAFPLSKLQDIENPNCLIVNTFMRMCCDPSPLIRRTAIKHIALTHISHEVPLKLMRDVDVNVRLEAYKRVSLINPKLLKIVQRQQAIINAIEEDQLSIKKEFQTTLLKKWVSIYDYNLLEFFNSLWLDAHVNDIEETRVIYDELMKIFFKCFQRTEILKYLPIGDDGLVPINQLTPEVSAYWCYFVQNLQKEENPGVEIDAVLPQLTPFCLYINHVINSKNNSHSEEWQNLQFQEILFNLFQMVAISDLADEVGRQHLQTLLRETLMVPKLSKNVMEKIFELYNTFITNDEKQCDDVCAILSDVREATSSKDDVPIELIEGQKANIKFLKSRMIGLEITIQKAVEEKNFQEAQKVTDEMNELSKQILELEAVVSQFEHVNKERDVRSDSETMCQCLDILSVFLGTTRIRTLTSSLRICLSEFVIPGMDIDDVALHAKIFLVLGQFCVLDKDLAVNKLLYMCTPLVATKFGKSDKSSIISSLKAISDIIRVHGSDILGNDEEETQSVSSAGSKSGRRKLYQETANEDVVAQCMNISKGAIIDIILDLMDEEDEDISHTAALALMPLVINGLLVNSSLLTRLFLKWLNPNIEKHDPKMHQILGSGLVKYAMHIKNSMLVIQRAIIPTLNFIGNAPNNSPFQDIELEFAVNSLCNMLKVQRTDISSVHKNLILEIIRTIKNRPNSKSVFILTKTLFVLYDHKYREETFVSDCVTDLEIAMQYQNNAKVLKLLMKFKNSLISGETNKTSTTINTITNTTRFTEESGRDRTITDKENETPIKNGEVSIRLNSSVGKSINSGSNSPIKPPSKKKVKKVNKDNFPQLAIIVERSEEIAKLVEETKCTDNASTSSEEEIFGKRKRNSTKRRSRKELKKVEEPPEITCSLSFSSSSSSGHTMSTRSKSRH
nr:condensin complex subunit 3 [Onthophagus taurus]